MLRVTWKLMAGVALCLLATAGSAQALTAQRVGSFQKPIYVTSAPADPDRLFVVERGGSILVVENGEVKPFASVPVSAVGEGGLLSIALSPDFATSGRLFIYYTGPQAENPDIHVAELVAGASGAPLSSLRNLLTIEHPNQDNHYGGQLQFGLEGNLFVSTGDGGGRDDLEHNAQDLGSLLGKILRIDPDAGISAPYTVPAGNPFAANPAPYDTIWSYGLRNPFRFSFDRQTGDLWIGDVGQETREEIDFAAAPGLGAGANYGWNCREGSVGGPATDEGCGSAPPGAFVDPIHDYVNPTQGCAVIGGYVARGPGYGDLFGRYLYGDLCAGDVRSFSPGNPESTDRYEGVHIGSLNSFGEDSCGRLYAVSGDGPLYRLVGSGDSSCDTSSGPPVASLTPSFVRVRAASRKVKRRHRALLSAWVSPCNGRRSGQVTLWQGRRNLGTRRLDRVCSARFRPRINRRTAFRVTVKADQTFASAISRRLTIRPLRHHRHKR